MTPLLSSTSTEIFPTVPHYTITEPLYVGSRTAVYRARSEEKKPVVIKLLKDAYPTFNELMHFRNQYAITKDLPVPGIVRSLSLEPWQNGYALVMEDFGGRSLQQFVQQHPLTLVETLSIAAQMAAILHELHQHRVVHKDIKPANILIHPTSRQIQLIDFSIASLLPKETQSIQSPKTLEGTLAYLAPEQTGRMNRAIDYRTDFYSLGVTLYELLAGTLPFTSEDPLALIHCHIAQQPIAVNQVNPAVPEIVAGIVEKLMSKNAEDRYQSALGLKFDIEQCLHQWKDTGEINGFSLGQRDLSDRFIIPEKLYGREAEVQSLFTAFERVSQGASELMLVAGFSGIGKTAVVNEVHKPIVRQRGYFIKGKFDQFNRNLPFSAFVQAFRDLVGQLLGESDADLQTWKNQILSALDGSAQVIIDLIPELARIVGTQPPASALSGTAAQNRFNLLFTKFIEVFTTAEHPLVIFIDDLQWADSPSLNLIKVLIAESKTGHLLLLGAYRDNEVSLAHPLMLTLDEMAKAEAKVQTMTLVPLNATSLNTLIAETFHTSPSVVKPLTQLVMQKTQGNPFFATQFLNTLYQERLISFDREAGHWQCDIIQVQAAALTDNVVELMAQQLRKLPAATQSILKLAACIGAQFDLETVSIVSEQSPTETAAFLWPALKEGLILPQSDLYRFYVEENQSTENQNAENQDADNENPENNALQPELNYRFLHDRVQQAAYSLIRDDQKQISHLTIGRHLLNQTDPEQREDRLFDIVSQLNMGYSLMTEATERETLLRLNLSAGCRAIATTAYDTAMKCLHFARKLLAANSWQTQYDLTLSCYTSAMEAAYLNGDLNEMEAHAESIMQQSQSLLDTAKVHEIKVEAYTNQGEFIKALSVGLKFLESSGIQFPSEPSDQDFGIYLAETQQQLAEHSVDSLLALPEMTSAISRHRLRVLVQLATPAYLGNPALYPLICLKQVQLSIEEGNSPASAFGYAVYGLLCSAVLGNIPVGYEFGQLALKMLDRFDTQEYAAKIIFHNYFFIEHWQQPLSSTLQPLKQGYTIGLTSGDIAYAGYSAVYYLVHAYWSGQELSALEKECTLYSGALERIQQHSALSFLQIFHQSTANLLGQSQVPTALNGDILNEQLALEKFKQLNDQTALWHFYSCKLTLSYLFEDYDAAMPYLHQARSYSSSNIGMASIPIFWFYAALTGLAQLSEAPDDPAHQSLAQSPTQSPTQSSTQSRRSGSSSESSSEENALWTLVAEAKGKLSDWATHGPMNCQHRYDLICAEEQRVLNNLPQALHLYELAIKGAQENGYLQEEALANELAAKFYLNWGKDKVAACYMQEAYYCYARWGAKAKVTALKRRYTALLQPILQPTTLSETTLSANRPNALMTVVSSDIFSHTGTHSTPRTTSLSHALDFATILEASQMLSGSIELDSLLHQLTQIVLQNSGGDRCALLLPEGDGKWQVRAIATVEETQISAVPFGNNDDLPVKLIQYVKNTQEVVVINDLKTDLPVIDDYLRMRQPKSVLCSPLINQGQLKGILYLKNRLASGAFTGDRILILNFLCTQAAISLENARLYQKVQQSLVDLQQAQLSMVQSEKMSALGGLVAGVAHEINNPVGCILGNVGATKAYIQDLLGLIDLYEQELSAPSEVIKEEVETIDLAFIRDDLPRLIRAMKDSGDRIKSISKSLRTFSRADTDSKQPFNPNEGIESTVLILRHRLKANELRPAIDVIAEYGEIPAIDCFPGQLNQVFMNILANAIDALDEASQDRSLAEMKAHPHQITIQTTADSEQVNIKISDNGPGIPETVKRKMFDHLFTTKAAGKGTGLGLAIAQQIIVEAHSGTIEVQSELGQGTEFCIQLPL